MFATELSDFGSGSRTIIDTRKQAATANNIRTPRIWAATLAFAARVNAAKNMMNATRWIAPRSTRIHLWSGASQASSTSGPHHAARKRSGPGCCTTLSGSTPGPAWLWKITNQLKW